MERFRQRKGLRPAKLTTDDKPVPARGLATDTSAPQEQSGTGMVLRTRSGKKLPEAVLAQAIAQVDLAPSNPEQVAPDQGAANSFWGASKAQDEQIVDPGGHGQTQPKAKQRRKKAATAGASGSASADGAATANGASSSKPPRKRKSTPSVLEKQKRKPAALTAGAPSHELAVWTEQSLDKGLRHLRAVDEKLVPLIDAHGAGASVLQSKGAANMFPSLTRSIVAQQLAVAAVKSIYDRFLVACKCTEDSPPSPTQVLSVPTEVLRACGLSGAKTSYIQDLARHFESGELCDEAIASMDDETLILELTKVKGIGRWSVDMFSMFHLGRPDILPVGDLGVRNGMKALYGLKLDAVALLCQEPPKPAEMEQLTDKWRPYRSLGSYFMWRAIAKPGASAKSAKSPPSKVPGIATSSKVPAIV